MASNSGSSRPGDVPDTNDRGGQDEDQQQPFPKRPKVNYSKVHEEFTVTQVCTLAGAHPEVFELWPTTFLDPLFHTVVAQGEALRAEADQVSGFWICWIRWNHFSKVAGKLKNLIFCYQVKFFLNYSLQYQCPAWRGDKLCQARCVCQVWDGGDGDTGVEIHHGPAQQGRGGL